MNIYLAIRNKRVIAEDDTLAHLMPKLAKVRISETGKISVNGVIDTISYNLYSFTQYEAFRDFAYYRFPYMAAKLLGVRIYKVERLS